MNELPDSYFDQLPGQGRDVVLLLQYLIDIQQVKGFIPASAVEQLADRLRVSSQQISALVEFYALLYAEDHGCYRFLFSDNITDRMLGSQQRLQQLATLLDVRPHTVDPDRKVYISTTSCTGLCDQGPAALINGLALSHLDEQRITEIASLVKQLKPVEQWPAEYFSVLDRIHRKDLLLNEELSHGESLRCFLERGAQHVLDELEKSNLRGRGGAGFKTHLKWQYCRQTAADERFVVCNADEGEPGTFKDRVLLSNYADDVIEGMTLCAAVIGARKGFIYLRGEYVFMREKLQACLQRRRQAKLLGTGILGQEGWDFDIQIQLGAGAYICGEESALLESLEGKRGIPRIRPPFPVEAGYLQKPTVVNNVESFLAVTRIAVRGGDWFCSAGTEQSTGTRLLSVSGDCAQPGVYEVPHGITVSEVLALCQAKQTQAVQIAGAAGITVPSCEFGRRILFEDLSTGGSFMVFNQQRDLLDMVENFTDFFVHESCGFCTPCRVGGALIRDIIKKVKNGKAAQYDLHELEQLSHVMQETAFCGLGNTAPNSVLDTLQKTPEIYQRRLIETDFAPAFDLDAALEDATSLRDKDDSQVNPEQPS